MNQTHLFLATVKTIRLRIKAQRRESGSLNNPTILTKSSHKPTEFAQEAKDVVMCISKLQDFLLKHRKDYINSIGYLISKSSSMTDSERDQIDSEAQEFIRSCSERIQNLRDEMKSISVGQQTRDYRHAVYESLGEYLKAVCKLYSEQRAIRVKRIVDRKRTSRLQPDGYKKLSLELSINNEQSTAADGQRDDLEPADPISERRGDDSIWEIGQESESATTTTGGSVESPRSPNTVGEPSGNIIVSNHPPSTNSVVEDLTEEERAVFEQENDQMFAEMNTMVDEVRQIEGRVIEISRLQEVFAEKILDQARQLDTVADQTVTASENVTGGNEQIRQAIKNKASFRLWILFVLVVCSFSLLFLDWYA